MLLRVWNHAIDGLPCSPPLCALFGRLSAATDHRTPELSPRFAAMSAVAAARVTATSPIEEITAVLHKCMLRGIPLDPMPVSQRKATAVATE